MGLLALLLPGLDQALPLPPTLRCSPLVLAAGRNLLGRGRPHHYHAGGAAAGAHYVNRFLRPAGATERVFFRPTPGPVQVSCANDHGRNADVRALVAEQ